MARGRKYLRLRKQPNMIWAIVGTTSTALGLLVGNEVLSTVGTTIGNISCTAIGMNDTCGVGAGVDYSAPFYQAFSFFGLNDTGGTWKSTGIVGILGLAAVASFVLTFFQVSFKGMA